MKIKLSTKEKKEIKTLSNTCLRLWRKVVKIEGNNRCAIIDCKKTKNLNAHHVESFSTNKTLRFDPMNGILLCPTHHKFGRMSAHRSFIFMYELIISTFPIKLYYLITHCRKKVELDKKYLLKQIEKLEGIIEEAKNPTKHRQKIIRDTQ